MQQAKVVLLHGVQYNRAVKKEIIKPQVKLKEKALNDFEDTVRDLLIVVLKSRGASLTEIAKIVDLNKSTVSRIIKNNKELLGILE